MGESIKVKDFINNYIEPNTIIRLWYKLPKGSDGLHEEVIKGDKPMMDHQLLNSKYRNYKVIGITDILYLNSNYIEAVNLIIERN